MGLDVRKFVASPFYARFASERGQARPDAFRELEDKFGLNPERDLDRVIIAGRDTSKCTGRLYCSRSPQPPGPSQP